MSRSHASYHAQLGTRATGGLKERDLLPNEAAERAPAGEPVDFMVVGSACADLATPYARRLIGQTIYVVGRVSIMARPRPTVFEESRLWPASGSPTCPPT